MTDPVISKIFHETQEGQLCAQHALNGLLQGSYFTAVDLSSLGRDLDNAENDMMDSSEPANSDQIKFAKEGSYNFDDSGFFSVQVIEKALEVWGLTLAPIAASENSSAREDPASQSAFILNYEEHWFCIRRFGGQRKRWYNLDSMKPAPELVSETYLHLLLRQFETEGYSVFIVNGSLPFGEADIAAVEHPDPVNDLKLEGKRLGSEEELARAIALSLGNATDEDDQDLEKAILASLSKPVEAEMNVDEMRRKRLEMFQKK
ncbi:Ataxin-3 [Phlyctochytrium planicorne]|nr:Ataxin-3 [Phlyctochytrium planicorne]